MARRKERDIWQYGDFQTPPELALRVCVRLREMGVEPSAILEPTCGRGAFLAAAAKAFPEVEDIFGVDINERYVAEAREAVGGRAKVEQGDFFRMDWPRVLQRNSGRWLFLGNPPWVTNAELGLLKSENLPAKSNFQRHRGLDALTGKANFDISEWMLLRQADWLKGRVGWIAMLVKTAVARKVLRRIWKTGGSAGRAAIFRIDAMRHFGAAVDACLFVLPMVPGEASRDCDLFDDLERSEPAETIGYRNGVMTSDVDSFMTHRHLIGPNAEYAWRSGVKHDCSQVMDLARDADGKLANGLNESVEIEDAYLFPMLKSSDVSKARLRSDRLMIVPQRRIGEATSRIAGNAPMTWAYLCAHAERLDARSSAIYRGKPRFSVFGVGDYSFAPWKVAVSGFYKTVRFVKIGPIDGKPVVFDDTVYFLACQSEAEADFALSLVQSESYSRLLRSMIFAADKRPVTAELLKRISLQRVADELGLGDRYRAFSRPEPEYQPKLALGF